MRRGNDEGSVYPDGNRYRAALWVANPDYGRIKGARPKKRVSWICATKAEARQMLKEQRAKRDAGTLVLSGQQTLSAYLERWLETRRDRLRDTSFDAYGQHVKRLGLLLGDARLGQLRAWHIEQAYGEMARQRLANNTIRTIHHVLSKALNDAVRWELLPSNPASRVLIPPAPKPKPSALSVAQIGVVLQAANGTPLFPFWLLLVSTGLRHGEALGLRWTDLADGALSVSRQLQRARGGGHVMVEVKSDAGHRTLTLPTIVLRSLEAHKARQNEQRLAAGPAWRNTQNLVFCREDGSPWHQAETRAVFYALLATAGLPRMRVHDLRHTAATHMLAQGTDVRTVSHRIGHSQASTTLNIYVHALPSMDEEAAARMNHFLEGVS